MSFDNLEKAKMYWPLHQRHSINHWIVALGVCRRRIEVFAGRGYSPVWRSALTLGTPDEGLREIGIGPLRVSGKWRPENGPPF